MRLQLAFSFLCSLSHPAMLLCLFLGCRAAFWKGRAEGELCASDSFLRLPSDSVPPSWFSKRVPRGGAQSSWPLPGLCLFELLMSINSEHVPVCRCAAAHTSTARVVVDSSRRRFVSVVDSSSCRRRQRRSRCLQQPSVSPVCADVPCVAVFLQTGVLSPYPVALLAADAFCDPSFSS